MRAVNVRGTELVLDTAVAAGLDPVVHVSSFGALVPTRQTPITPEHPVGEPRETYLDSKAQADRVARRHQTAGAPVVATSPDCTPPCWSRAGVHAAFSGRAATSTPASTWPCCVG
ncbi:SDR family oxidoreductase [Micromonospora gifhornensis]|uniref:SDR family oxidoreductase n=1 Tax=Micromonospora gifhornensis TaxID=84594 RepID=UPI00365CBEDB